MLRASFQKTLQHDLGEHDICHRALRPGALLLMLLHAFGVREVHPAAFGRQPGERRRAHPCLRQIRRGSDGRVVGGHGMADKSLHGKQKLFDIDRLRQEKIGRAGYPHVLQFGGGGGREQDDRCFGVQIA